MQPAIIAINDILRKIDTHCKVKTPEKSALLIDDIFKAISLCNASDTKLSGQVINLEAIWHRWNNEGTVNKAELSFLVGQNVETIDKYVKGGYGVFLKRSCSAEDNTPVYFKKENWEDFNTHLLSVT